MEFDDLFEPEDQNTFRHSQESRLVELRAKQDKAFDRSNFYLTVSNRAVAVLGGLAIVLGAYSEYKRSGTALILALCSKYSLDKIGDSSYMTAMYYEYQANIVEENLNRS